MSSRTSSSRPGSSQPESSQPGSSHFGSSRTGPILRVGVDVAPPPPMCFGVPGTSEFKGFEVDLVEALSARLGRPWHAQALLWAEMLERLEAGALDLVCTAATVTPERVRRFTFSDPYLRTALAIVSRRDRPLTALVSGEHRIAARVGTPAEDYARRESPRDLVSLHFNEEIYLALSDGSVDAVIDDWPIAAWFAAQSPGLGTPARLAGTDASYAFVLPTAGRDLQRSIDDALQALVEDGTYRRLYDEWMAPIVGDTCDVTRRARATGP